MDRVCTLLFSAKEAAAKYLGTHMYHAFYYLRLREIGAETLVLRNTAPEGGGLIYPRVHLHDGHVFSMVDDRCVSS